MPQEINLPLILIAALLASVSPGPATLAIAGTSMASGKGQDWPLPQGSLRGHLSGPSRLFSGLEPSCWPTYGCSKLHVILGPHT